MRTIKEITDQMVEVQDFNYALETLRKMHAIYVVNILFTGHQSMNLGSEDNLTLLLKQTAIDHYREIAGVKANNLRDIGIDPGLWWTEFET